MPWLRSRECVSDLSLRKQQSAHAELMSICSQMRCAATRSWGGALCGRAQGESCSRSSNE